MSFLLFRIYMKEHKRGVQGEAPLLIPSLPLSALLVLVQTLKINNSSSSSEKQNKKPKGPYGYVCVFKRYI